MVMQLTLREPRPGGAIHPFVRNRYFYGKLLDVHHLELEQDYLNGKRWLLNRLVSGYGVICGLDVQPAQKGRAVVVTPGIALDRGGREIVVACTSEPIAIPPRSATTTTAPAQGSCEPEDY